jgi:hypothetical protein
VLGASWATQVWPAIGPWQRAMGGQQPQRPQFVRVASFFGLSAGLADQPSPRRLCDVRRSSRTRQVVDCLKRSHRGNPSGTACNPLAVNAERCGRLTGAASISQVQDDRRPLDMMSRGGARPGKYGQNRAGLLGQGRRAVNTAENAAWFRAAPRLPRARRVERCRAIRPYAGDRTSRKYPGKRIQGVRTVPRIPAHTNWDRRTGSG